jgi:hypothetical protein
MQRSYSQISNKHLNCVYYETSLPCYSQPLEIKPAQTDVDFKSLLSISKDLFLAPLMLISPQIRLFGNIEFDLSSIRE